MNAEPDTAAIDLLNDVHDDLKTSIVILAQHLATEAKGYGKHFKSHAAHHASIVALMRILEERLIRIEATLDQQADRIAKQRVTNAQLAEALLDSCQAVSRLVLKRRRKT